MMKRIFQVSGILCIFTLLIACTYVRFFSTEHDVTPTPTQLKRFLNAFSLIKTYYVKSVSDEDLINNAIRGMAEGLDAHSTFLDETDLQYVKQLTTGKYNGIGLEVVPDDGALKVITPLDGSPAEKAGILPDDDIIKVDQEAVSDMTYNDAIERMRGPAGTKVHITLVRPKTSDLIELDIVRAKLSTQNVRSRLLAQNIGYVRITAFQKSTPADVKAAILQLDKTNQAPLKGLILDLRNNPGGILDSAADVSDLFLDARYLGNNDLIVYSKNRAGETVFNAHADDKDILDGAPLVILINQGSASGAEIVAGALHDHHRAKLVGMKSFGKGSVQVVIPLDADSALKVTSALYYTPNGNLIDHIGIKPDVAVNMKPFAKNDVQLAAALKLFSSSLNA